MSFVICKTAPKQLTDKELSDELDVVEAQQQEAQGAVAEALEDRMSSLLQEWRYREDFRETRLRQMESPIRFESCYGD